MADSLPAGAVSATGRRWAAELCLAETEAYADDVLGRAFLDLGFEDVLAAQSKSGISTLWNRLGGALVTDGDAFGVAKIEVVRALHPSSAQWAANYKKVFSHASLLDNLGPSFNDYLQLPKDFGHDALQTIVSVPCPGRPHLLRIGLGSSAPMELLRDRIDDVHLLIRLYGTLPFDDPSSSEPDDGALPGLSPRQLECLRWAAAGKTYTDIADIVGLSERGVRFHLNSARQALGFATIIQTIVHAAKTYDIDPLDGR